MSPTIHAYQEMTCRRQCQTMKSLRGTFLADDKVNEVPLRDLLQDD